MTDPRIAIQARIKQLDRNLGRLRPHNNAKMQKMLQEWSELNRQLAELNLKLPPKIEPID